MLVCINCFFTFIFWYFGMIVRGVRMCINGEFIFFLKVVWVNKICLMVLFLYWVSSDNVGCVFLFLSKEVTKLVFLLKLNVWVLIFWILLVLFLFVIWKVKWCIVIEIFFSDYWVECELYLVWWCWFDRVGYWWTW